MVETATEGEDSSIVILVAMLHVADGNLKVRLVPLRDSFVVYSYRNSALSFVSYFLR